MAESPSRVDTSELRRQAVGVPGIVFFVVAAAAPLAATLGASPVGFSALGIGAPGAYLVTGIILLLFAAGYGAMSRYVTSSAGFAAYLETAFGRVAGFVAAAVALLSYNGMLLGLFGLFGFLANTVFGGLFGLQVDWKIWTLVAWAVVAILGYLDVNLSARVLGVLMIGEVVILLVFDAAVFAKGGSSGVNFAAFTPSNVFASGTGVAFLFAAASFVGFEATAIYGEEAKDPARTVPRATYTAVGLIAVFYALSTWAIALSYPGDSVQKAATDDPSGFVFAKNTEFVGSFATDIMNILLITSTFAVLLAFHNTLSRYMFALGRARVLPHRLGRTHHQWQSPHVASLIGTTVTIVVVGAFMLAGADPFTQLYSWLVGLGTLGVLLLQAATAVAVVVFFLTKQRSQFDFWTCGVAPVLGALGLLTAAYLALDNWDILAAASSGFATKLPWLLVLAAMVGAVWAFATRGTARSFAGAFSDNTSESEAIISGAVPPRLAD